MSQQRNKSPITLVFTPLSKSFPILKQATMSGEVIQVKLQALSWADLFAHFLLIEWLTDIKPNGEVRYHNQISMQL
jgi:hypothetical protein